MFKTVETSRLQIILTNTQHDRVGDDELDLYWQSVRDPQWYNLETHMTPFLTSINVPFFSKKTIYDQELGHGKLYDRTFHLGLVEKDVYLPIGDFYTIDTNDKLFDTKFKLDVKEHARFTHTESNSLGDRIEVLVTPVKVKALSATALDALILKTEARADALERSQTEARARVRSIWRGEAYFSAQKELEEAKSYASYLRDLRSGGISGACAK